MRRSLLTAFRGSDGRSLTRALAVLLVVNAIVAGFYSGAMAAPAGLATVLCVTPAGDADNAPPLRADFHDHCLASCTAPALADIGTVEPGAPALVRSIGLSLRPVDEPRSIVSHHPQPRGPPILA